MEIYLVVIITMVALGAGSALMYALLQSGLNKKAIQIVKDAEAQAEILKKDRMLEAKEKLIQLKAEHEKEVMQRNQQVIANENKIKQKEQSLNQ
jgi:ribonuclease Y